MLIVFILSSDPLLRELSDTRKGASLCAGVPVFHQKRRKLAKLGEVPEIGGNQGKMSESSRLTPSRRRRSGRKHHHRVRLDRRKEQKKLTIACLRKRRFGRLLRGFADSATGVVSPTLGLAKKRDLTIFILWRGMHAGSGRFKRFRHGPPNRFGVTREIAEDVTILADSNCLFTMRNDRLFEGA